MSKKRTGNKHGKKEAPAVPNVAENIPRENSLENWDKIIRPEVEKQISSENPEIQIQECPADACQELQDVWASGKGCYNSNSNYCKSCGTDFPATKEICEKRSVESQTKVVEKKSTPRISSVTKEGFGHRAGTQAAGIDAILQEGGGTPVQFVALLKERGYNVRNITDDDLWRRTLTHMSDLKRNHGIKIVKTNGVYAMSV